jgi:hypothetical protein
MKPFLHGNGRQGFSIPVFEFKIENLSQGIVERASEENSRSNQKG